MAKQNVFVDISLLGDERLIKKFKKLPGKFQKKVARKGFRSAAKIIQRSIKQRAPVGDTGALKKNIKLKALKRSRNRIGINVQTGTRDQMGISRGSKWYYPAILEFGNPKRGLRPRKFMLKGFLAVEDKARDELKAVMGREIIKVARKK